MATYQALIDKGGGGQIDGKILQQERIEKIVEIQGLTDRPLIVYFSNFIKGGNVPNNSIDDTDITGFSDLIERVPGDSLDVLIHSPGGLAESAERIVGLLRAKFSSVRFIVPHTAYSAATLLTFSGDQILMDDRSALGPVDPQIVFRDPVTGEVYFVPSQTITLGFRRAIEALREGQPEVLKAYLPMLNKLNMHLFEVCNNAEELTRTLALDWLTRYMFNGEGDAAERAQNITGFFTDHSQTRSHRRGIGILKAKELRLSVLDMRENPKLRQAIWELYCAVEFFVDQSDTAKFYENAFGVSWRRRFQAVTVQIPVPVMPGPPQAPPTKQRPGGGKR